jgi:hypothetical protein
MSGDGSFFGGPWRRFLLLFSLVAAVSGPFSIPAAANAANVAGSAANLAASAAANEVGNAATQADGVKGNGSGAQAGVDPAAPNSEIDRDVYAEVFRLLFIILALAVVLESGLAIIFNWRPFVRNFDGRGVRTVIAFFAALLVANGLDLDLIDRLYAALDPADVARNTLGPIGEVITALVLAGGSSGVNNIFQALGFRRIGRAEEVTPKPKPSEGWLAVRLQRQLAVGPVRVEIQQGGAGPWLLIGTIKGNSPPPAAFAWAVRDQTRFPTTGGYAVPEGVAVELRLTGTDFGGVTRTANSGPLTLAGGAIIDIEITL